MAETMQRALALDMLDVQTFVRGHPHDIYDALRATDPVWRHPGSATQAPFFVLLRHRDIEAVSRDSERFTSTRGFRLATDKRLTIPPHVTAVLSRTVIALDPPEQQALRGVINPMFTPRGLAHVEERLRRWIADLFETIAQEERVEFVSRIASVIPIKTLCLVLGLPESDDARVFDWTNAVLGSDDSEYAPTIDATARAYEEMFAYALWLAEQRRTEPRSDLMTALVHATPDGRPLDDVTMQGMVSILISAGNETTRNSLSGSVMALAVHPEQRTRLREDPAAMPRAVDELLRYVSPVVQMMRTARVPLEIGGVPIAAGERVVMAYGAANHDPEIFEDPHALRIDRRNANRHLSMGVGFHHCAGARMATMQLRLMLAEILDRYPEYEIEGEPQQLASNLVWGVKALQVRFR